MNRLDNAKSILWHYFELIARKSGTNLDSDCRTEIEGIVDDIVESIDPAPVAHGEWTRSGSGWMCKSCGYQTEESTVNMILHNYCPSCGAKMDIN